MKKDKDEWMDEERVALCSSWKRGQKVPYHPFEQSPALVPLELQSKLI